MWVWLIRSAYLCRTHAASTAKKEDNPEDALKDFQAIVEQEDEKGDWYEHENPFTTALFNSQTGVSRH